MSVAFRWWWVCAALAAAALALYWGAPPAAPGDFRAVAARRGYRSERHEVTTEDGYVLTLFRIRRGARCGAAGRGPVYLMNGLLLGAESWLDAAPHALGLLLPDACYDTWLGSARGSRYGRRHRSLDPRRPPFWQFSADEIAYYDVAATVDYILAATRARRLSYVGYSQGGSLALMLLAERPQYGARLRVVLAAAPPAALQHSSAFSWLLRAAAALEPALAAAGVHEVFAAAAPLQALAGRFCKYRAVRDTLCKGFFALIDNPHPGSIADETYGTLFDHFPSGTSVRTLARYGQAILSGRFQKYDFGERDNLRKYGRPQPPEYDVSSIPVPVVIVQGAGDAMVLAAESRRLAARLPRGELRVLSDPAWNHLDSLFSRHIADELFPIVNETLLKYNT